MRKKDFVALNRRRTLAKKIAFENGKGGCGKTSTCLAQGMHLARMGYDVLFVDADPQSNLSQRLGIHDDDFVSRRIDNLFTALEHSRPEEALNDLPIIVQYRYNYRLADSDKKVGKIAIIAGRNTSEIEAVATQAKLSKKMEEKNISEKFNEAFEHYSKFFDYILFDTPPNLENNLLCDLVTKNVDSIICPIDGIEAARGTRNLISYVKSRTFRQDKTPSMNFVMIKYQKDLKSGIEDTDIIDLQDKVPNAVYRALKEYMGGFMCENGIPELASLKNRVYGGFGRKTPYDDLCQEIKDKVDGPTDNIFDYWTPLLSNSLNLALNEIEDRSLGDRKPTFKFPYFGEKYIQENLDMIIVKTVPATFAQQSWMEDVPEIDIKCSTEFISEDNESEGGEVETSLTDSLLEDDTTENVAHKIIPLKQGRAKYTRKT